MSEEVRMIAEIAELLDSSSGRLRDLDIVHTEQKVLNEEGEYEQATVFDIEAVIAVEREEKSDIEATDEERRKKYNEMMKNVQKDSELQTFHDVG